MAAANLGEVRGVGLAVRFWSTRSIESAGAGNKVDADAVNVRLHRVQRGKCFQRPEREPAGLHLEGEIPYNCGPASLRVRQRLSHVPAFF